MTNSPQYLSAKLEIPRGCSTISNPTKIKVAQFVLKKAQPNHWDLASKLLECDNLLKMISIVSEEEIAWKNNIGGTQDRFAFALSVFNFVLEHNSKTEKAILDKPIPLTPPTEKAMREGGQLIFLEEYKRARAC